MNKKILSYILVLMIVISGLFFLYKYFRIGDQDRVKIEFRKNGEAEGNIQITEENREISPEIFEDSTETEKEQEEKIDASVKANENGNKEENKEEAGVKIKNKLVSWGYQASNGRTIDTVIIHSSYNALGGDFYDLSKLLSEYKSYGVSPHYLIDRLGNIYKLVEEKDIAYHAGESKVPDGRTGVNNFSIGIELINTKRDKNTSAQYVSLKYLLSQIGEKYQIKYTLGHDDIAKGRKSDPWNFDWNKIK